MTNTTTSTTNSATSTTNSTIQNIVNQAAIRNAESQYRLARYWTPFGFEPEPIDFLRVASFTADVMKAFPEATGNLQIGLERVQKELNESKSVLEVFIEQGTKTTLSEEQLFITAGANVRQQSFSTVGDPQAAQ